MLWAWKKSQKTSTEWSRISSIKSISSGFNLHPYLTTTNSSCEVPEFQGENMYIYIISCFNLHHLDVSKKNLCLFSRILGVRQPIIPFVTKLGPPRSLNQSFSQGHVFTQFRWSLGSPLSGSGWVVPLPNLPFTSWLKSMDTWSITNDTKARYAEKGHFLHWKESLFMAVSPPECVGILFF